MSQVTKEDLAEINQELTETIRRLDRENEELMEKEKAATVDAIEAEREKLKREMSRGRDEIESALDAIRAAVVKQKSAAIFWVLIAILLSTAAVGAAMWAQKKGVDPMWICLTPLGLAAIATLIQALYQGEKRKQKERREKVEDLGI